MYLPPNGAGNGAFLETLRLLLVHETTRPRRRAERPAARIRDTAAVASSGKADRGPQRADELRSGLVLDRRVNRLRARHGRGAGSCGAAGAEPAAAAAARPPAYAGDGGRTAVASVRCRIWNGRPLRHDRHGRAHGRVRRRVTRPPVYSRSVAVTTESRSWEQLFAGRTRGEVGNGVEAVLAFLGVPDIISFAGGFPDPLTFPRERAAALLAEFGAGNEAAIRRVRPHSRARRHARRRRRTARVRAGPAAREQRPADHERINGRSRARRQVVPRPWRPRRDRGTDVSRRDHGLPQLRGERRPGAARRAPARCGRPRAASG